MLDEAEYFPVISFFPTVLFYPAADHAMYVLDWMRPPAPVGGPTQASMCF